MTGKAALVCLCVVITGLVSGGCGKAPESARAPEPAASAPPPQEIIIDNVDPGCQIISGVWAPADAYIEFTNNTEDGYCNADAVRLVSDF